MIFSDRKDKRPSDFESLLDDSHEVLVDQASTNPKYFINRTPSDFEKDVYESMCEAANGTDFENTIELIAGHKFPDIIANKFYGVEVKTTKKDHWKSTGNSVLETTRIDGVERIYLFFGKLASPPGFKYRLYQDCLYDIAVTHSPRYLIDMDLNEGEQIFNKIRKTYDELRSSDNPIKPFVDYYRSVCLPGEEPWWMGEESDESLMKPTVSLWRNLDAEKKESLRIEAMARFPEMFGNSQAKYQKLATWLAARHGVVDSSLRDRFSAGGKCSISIGNVNYDNLPRIFLNLKENIVNVIECVKNISPDDAKYHWGLEESPGYYEITDIWCHRLIQNAAAYIGDEERSNKFLVHLLADSFDDGDCPISIQEMKAQYGI